MNPIDMAEIGANVGLSGRFFVTREKGERAYHMLRGQIEAVPKNQAVVLRFPSNQLIDASFADETIIRLGEEYMQGAFGEGSVLLQGLTEDSVHNLAAAIRLRRLKLAFIVLKPEGKWDCVGQLEESLRETLKIAATHDHMTAPELAQMLGLAINTASNRLKRLYDQRLLRRESEITENGLQYTYYFWVQDTQKE